MSVTKWSWVNVASINIYFSYNLFSTNLRVYVEIYTNMMYVFHASNFRSESTSKIKTPYISDSFFLFSS